MELLKVWAPFIILIVVWIFFMNRMRGGSGFQNNCLQEMKTQTAAQLEIARSLDRIAVALEKPQS